MPAVVVLAALPLLTGAFLRLLAVDDVALEVLAAAALTGCSSKFGYRLIACICAAAADIISSPAATVCFLTPAPAALIALPTGR